MQEIFAIAIVSLAVGAFVVAIAVALLRWVFLAPLIKGLRAIQSRLDTLHGVDEYSSRQLQSIWHSVNMIRDGERPDA